ncbi:hypothetical protein D3C86_1839130 [compost metagenome]
MDPGFDIFDGFYPLNLGNRLFHQLKFIGVEAVSKIMCGFAEDLPCRLADH